MRTVTDPDTDAALSFLQAELLGLQKRRGHLVEVVADCEVVYRGRARSDLHRGERLVLLKPDGTLLVHTGEKAKPVNWQPPGARFDASLEDGRIVLSAIRTKPEELVRITFHAIHLLVSVPLRDSADLALLGSEDDLQRILFENPDLVEPGYRPQKRERDSARGFYDIDGRDAQGRRLIVELKRTTAGVKEATQLWRYVEELGGGVRGMLVAPRIAAKARTLLASHDLEWKELQWEGLLPQIESMRRAGQASLGRFADAPTVVAPLPRPR